MKVRLSRPHSSEGTTVKKLFQLATLYTSGVKLEASGTLACRRQCFNTAEMHHQSLALKLRLEKKIQEAE